MSFRIEKMELLPGASSMIGRGEAYQGDDLALYDYETKEHKYVGLRDVTEGWQVVLYHSFGRAMNTSKIAEILERTNNTVTFKTQTSIYKLTDLD